MGVHHCRDSNPGSHGGQFRALLLSYATHGVMCAMNINTFLRLCSSIQPHFIYVFILYFQMAICYFVYCMHYLREYNVGGVPGYTKQHRS